MGINGFGAKEMRCVSCGAPLPEKDLDDDFIKCEYCGFSQKKLEVTQYLEKLRGEIFSWVKNIVPVGNMVSSSIDNLARHNIFVHNIKPKILGEYVSTKSRLSMILTFPLLALPFFGLGSVRLIETPKRSFEKLARVIGLEPMAAVDEDREFFDKVKTTYEVYSYLTNSFDLISKSSDPEFVIKNFEIVSKCLEGKHDLVVERKRMMGVLEFYLAVRDFLAGHLGEATSRIKTAIVNFNEVIKEAKGTSDAAMIPATSRDLDTLKTLENLVKISVVCVEGGELPTCLLPQFEKYFDKAEEIRKQKDSERHKYRELTQILFTVIANKNGKFPVQFLPGEGDFVVPLWDVSITYSFQTGSLFWKKGKSVHDRVFVSTTAPLGMKTITDVFGISEAGFITRVSGGEKTLSKGTLRKVSKYVESSYIPKQLKVFPPFISREEAEEIVEGYLRVKSRQMDGKIKFGNAHVTGIIFAQAQKQGNDIHIPALGKSQIKLAPHVETLADLAF
ncbi:MAG: hypothetical protein ACTSUV_02420 [Candidatus Ranarchaeia archaeon]